MGWINRAKAKASRLLSYVEEDSRSCIPTSQHCYIFVPYMVDLRCAPPRGFARPAVEARDAPHAASSAPTARGETAE